MDSCGQCVGFRAKGLTVPTEEEGHVCEPNDSCPKNCPALGLDLSAMEQALQVTDSAPEKVENTTESEGVNNPVTATVNCHRCQRTDNDAALISCRIKGESLWVCTKCLPTLIHG